MTHDTIFYKVNIIFDRFVPDTSDETSRLALAQATSYTIMDYFNQYTYAEISANMITEITYTETLTFWSTFVIVILKNKLEILKNKLEILKKKLEKKHS